MDIFEKCYAPSLAKELKEAGVYPYFHALQSRQDVEVQMEGKRRIMLGAYVLSSGYYDAYYRKAAQVRRLIRDEYLAALDKCDALWAPVSPVTAWNVGSLTADPLQMYLMDAYTLSLNLAGLPGLSMPVGLGAESGMPVGMQLFGKAFAEGELLSLGYALEQVLPGVGAVKL